ncbi:hypothetical protein SAMN05216502_101150 [Citrobacter amalonaticus]|nr:hypothetical protein SAMN05216502_101150 [Citrobacter amalonaticus]
MRQGHSFDCWLMQPVDKAMPVITRNIDRSIWRDLMLKFGIPKKNVEELLFTLASIAH